jgi:hypothetical protein
MKKVFILLLTASLTLAVCMRKPYPLRKASEIKSVTIYALDGLKTHSQSSLSSAMRYEVPVAEFRKIMPEAKRRHGLILWKGSSYGEIKMKDGTLFLLNVSNYGGFFSVHGQSGIYMFEDEARETWDRIDQAMRESFHEQRRLRSYVRQLGEFHVLSFS